MGFAHSTGTHQSPWIHLSLNVEHICAFQYVSHGTLRNNADIVISTVFDVTPLME